MTVATLPRFRTEHGRVLHPDVPPKAARLLRSLIAARVAPAQLWLSSERTDPVTVLQAAVRHWGRAHEDRHTSLFDINLTLTAFSERFLYQQEVSLLILNPIFLGETRLVAFEPTLRLLAAHHPALARSFHDYFVMALDRWFSVWHYQEANSYIEAEEMSREGMEPEELEDMPELLRADLPCGVAGAERLTIEECSRSASALPDPLAQHLLRSVVQLYEISHREDPPFDPELSDEASGMRIPILAACMYRHDTIHAQLDDTLEVNLNSWRSAKPHQILRLQPDDPESIRAAFGIAGHVFHVLRLAGALIHSMPDALIPDD